MHLNVLEMGIFSPAFCILKDYILFFGRNFSDEKNIFRQAKTWGWDNFLTPWGTFLPRRHYTVHCVSKSPTWYIVHIFAKY